MKVRSNISKNNGTATSLLNPGYSVDYARIDFKHEDKRVISKCSFSEDRVLLCIPTLRMKAVISYMN